MLKPYMDLGWHTVPLKGKLERLPNGEKTLPIFEENWRQYYKENVNKKNTPLGGTITGKCSNIIAIDCDNELTWNLFRALDPYNKFVFISKGKGYEAGTIIYKYTQELPQSFAIKDDTMELDFYSNNGFVYLPTEANKTKVPLTELPELSEAPDSIVALLAKLYKSTQTVATESNKANDNLFTANFLNPLVKQFVANKGEFMPGLFRILTPKQFRKYEEYVKNATLHPKQVKRGDGSTYLASVSAILGADFSIDKELYAEAMSYINDLFEFPMDDKRFDKTIIRPMINGSSSINGRPIWAYDDDWEQFRSIYKTKDQSTIELIYDDMNQLFYAVDSSRSSYNVFANQTELYNHLQAVTATEKRKKDIILSVPLANVISVPNKDFGFHAGRDATKRDLNLFTTTPALNVFYNPQDYAEYYREPALVLKFFEHLIPDEGMRNYFLSFLKTKLSLFEYSAVIMYFIGVPGSGKGTAVRLLGEIVGNIPSPSAKEFLEKFNKWAEGAYFVELDEYSEQLSTMREKEEALGKLKSITGKQKIDIRRMRTDSYSYHHNITFIMTMNKGAFMLDAEDRRVAVFETPRKLAERKFVRDVGGVSEFQKAMFEQVNDFCYYLSTEVNPLNSNDYQTPPMIEGKFNLIANGLPAAMKIAYSLSKRRPDYLVELALDYLLDDLAKEIKTGTVLFDNLYDLYMELTNDKGTRRGLISALRSAQVEVSRTGNGGAQYVVSDYLPVQD